MSQAWLAAICLLTLGCARSFLSNPAPGGPTAEPDGRVFAVETAPEDVYVRVVDVGAGLCVVVRAPGPAFMVYDAGPLSGEYCLRAVREIVGTAEIELMILSHGDPDHIGEATAILEEYRARQIWRTGDQRTGMTWKSVNGAIGKETTEEATILNLATFHVPAKFSVPLGDARITFLGGSSEWDHPTGWSVDELHEILSIVVRLDYRGRSVLLTGDAIGRQLGSPPSTCTGADEELVERHNDGAISLDTDVVIAAKHGGDEGSTACLIAAATPTHVVFSAGHDHQHPTASAAQRFLDGGVPRANFYRTDRGDDEPGQLEWKEGSLVGCVDPRGDDDVEISLRDDGTIEVAYRLASEGC